MNVEALFWLMVSLEGTFFVGTQVWAWRVEAKESRRRLMIVKGGR